MKQPHSLCERHHGVVEFLKALIQVDTYSSGLSACSMRCLAASSWPSMHLA